MDAEKEASLEDSAEEQSSGSEWSAGSAGGCRGGTRRKAAHGWARSAARATNAANEDGGNRRQRQLEKLKPLAGMYNEARFHLWDIIK